MSSATTSLAGIGTRGQNMQNAERDFEVHCNNFCDGIPDLKPYGFKMPFKRNKDGGVIVKEVHMLLPHELFAQLYLHRAHDFAKFFGTSARRSAYWTSLSDTDWFKGHPGRTLLETKPHMVCPVSLHGDDIACKRGLAPLSALVLSIASPATWDSFDGILALFCLILKLLLPDSIEFAYAVVTWSLNAMADGHWPTVDAWGRPLSDHFRRAMAGSWLCPFDGEGLRAYLSDMLGDMKWLKEALQLPYYYGKNFCCAWCTASKLPGEDYIGNFAHGAFEGRAKRNLADYLRCFVVLPWLARIFGFSLDIIRIDFMHTDHQGVAGWLAAHGLLSAAQSRAAPTGTWQVRMDAALRQLFHLFVAWCHANLVEHSEREFSVTRLSLGKSAADWPDFKGKAHNTAAVCKFLRSFLDSPAFAGHEDKMLLNAFVGWSEVQAVMHEAADTFSEQQANRFLKGGLTCLRSWGILAQLSARRHVQRHQIKPKHHAYEEAVRFAHRTRRNPRTTWLYRHESFVGLIGKVANKTHPATASRRVLQRWLVGFCRQSDGNLTRVAFKRKLRRGKLRLKPVVVG